MLDNRLPRFASRIWLTAGLSVVMVIASAVYVHSEKRIDHANDLRHQSFLLADELRQSSDDLTRMARTYVVTGDPIYKTHYQDILDIRNGTKPRPYGYQQIYWDFVLADVRPSRAGSQQAIALVELMRRAGFSAEELRKLEVAQAHSDELTATEFSAMKLAESSGPEAEANRARARLMMHDATYHQAKAAIMKPIDEFYGLTDKRTIAAVHSAESNAATVRDILIALGLVLLFMLWRTYTSLHKIMGGSVDEVHAQIAVIGSGDFSSPIPVADNMENGVLGWLSKTQIKLRNNYAERKQIEQELRLAATAFESQAAITITDANRVILKVNQAFTRITGYSAEEAIGQTPALLNSGRQDGAFYQAMWACLGRDKFWQGEIWNQRKDGTIFPEWLTISAVTDADGKVTNYVASYSDITQLKAAEEELRRHRDHLQELVAEQTTELKQAKEAAERANQAKSEFLANMSHELRTPMHAIISFSELGERMIASAPPDKVRGYFQRILTSGERLLKLINSLLELSRLEAGKMTIELVQHDLRTLIEEVLTELELLASSKQLHIAVDASACHTIARVDAKSYGQVVRNLLANAIKFTPAGGVIAIRLLPAELPHGRRANESGMRPAITLEVRDSGIGIPEDELEAVFDKFAQSSKTRTGAGGTGLGLAICKEIATACRGRISARNNPGGGTTFAFTLPLLK